MTAIRRISEDQRLDVLRGYGLLDTAGELQFDAIVRAASRSLNVPIAIMSLVDAERQWFKARIGIDVAQTDRSISFCAHAIEKAEEIFEVGDASCDPRFAANPLVTGEPGIRFYAGAPIRVRDGAALGTICVLDTRPRGYLSAPERDYLLGLARRAAEAIELRQIVRQLAL